MFDRREAPKKFFRLPTLVFSLPTLPYVTVAHPARRSTLQCMVPSYSVYSRPMDQQVQMIGNYTRKLKCAKDDDSYETT